MIKSNIFYFIGICILILLFNNSKSENIPKKDWELVDTILKNINEPVFLDSTYNITDFGAIGDGITLNTQKINNTIHFAHENGGGTVLIPKGTFLTGALHLLSNVRIHIDKEAILLFSINPKDYLPVVITRWEGVDCYNYSPLIYAYGQENIGITGTGKLNGQADTTNWWVWKGRKESEWKNEITSKKDSTGRSLLMKYNEEQVPVDQRIMGENHYLRPPFIQFYKCKNILMQDFTIENSPFWTIHPLLSENITVRGLYIKGDGPNTDGCNPESCKNVLIENCFFNTGDDCIAMKSGRNFDGRRWNVPSENIIVRNCKMQNGHGGIVIGSEISGGCKNIFVENCKMNSPGLDRAIRIKTNNFRGGIIEDFYVRNIQVGQVKEAVIKINCKYESSEDQGEFLPLIRNVYISNVRSQKAYYAFLIRGIKGSDCIENIQISNCVFSGVSKPYYIENVNKIKLTQVTINGQLIGDILDKE